MIAIKSLEGMNKMKGKSSIRKYNFYLVNYSNFQFTVPSQTLDLSESGDRNTDYDGWKLRLIQ